MPKMYGFLQLEAFHRRDVPSRRAFSLAGHYVPQLIGRGPVKFVLVNGKTPRPQSFCAMCCEPIGESYLREIATRLYYCDHTCYLGLGKRTVPALQYGRPNVVEVLSIGFACRT